jgi:hypothetical protein
MISIEEYETIMGIVFGLNLGAIAYKPIRDETVRNILEKARASKKTIEGWMRQVEAQNGDYAELVKGLNERLDVTKEYIDKALGVKKRNARVARTLWWICLLISIVSFATLLWSSSCVGSGCPQFRPITLALISMLLVAAPILEFALAFPKKAELDLNNKVNGQTGGLHHTRSRIEKRGVILEIVDR